jgi:hypothetical protein
LRFDTHVDKTTEYLTNCHLQVVAAYYYIHEKKFLSKVPKKKRGHFGHFGVSNRPPNFAKF